jgi:poly(A) polymerase
MRIFGDWLNHPGTLGLMQVLEGKGHLALFVGGCVRNALYFLPVSDIDIATDARPQEVTRIAEAAGFKVVPTGIEHGTVTVVAHGKPHEVTTFRRDVKTDGRRAVVAFSSRLEEDAQRRDFTMNALYADRQGKVIDPLGGLADHQAHIVRFVGDAETRIREDYLRILRFFRFHAIYGDPDKGIDADALAGCARLAEGLDNVSKERVGSEMRKLLAAGDPAPAMSTMDRAGVLARILPGADPRPLAYLHSLELDAEPDWLRRLAVIGGQDPARRLRLSTVEAYLLADLQAAIGSMESPAVLGWKFGIDRGADALLIRAAALEAAIQPLDMAEVRRGATATFPVTAADLMPAFQGRALGDRLKTLKARWLASDLRLTGPELLAG